MKDMRSVIVIEGEYKGRVGKADFLGVEDTGNIMFYPVEGKYPYRVCLSQSQVKEID